ncbi:MAG: hypothetical protein ACYDAC_06490 [Candidatus Dormibacteria bacterium]
MPRRARGRALLAVGAAAIVAVGVASGLLVARLTASGQPSATTPPPATSSGAPAAQAVAQYQQALAAMRASQGFHYEADSGGPMPQTIAGDAGRSDGRQVITVASSFGAEKFTLLLVSGTVYFQGDAPALEDQLGVATAKAQSLAGTWVSVVRTDGPYAIIAPGITVADQAQELEFVPRSVEQATTSSGPVTRILGTVPGQNGAPAASVRLDVSPTTHLPITSASTLTVNGTTVHSTITFSAWGQAPAVSVPAGAVAWATVGGSPPPGGYGSGGAAASPSPNVQGARRLRPGTVV